MRRSVRTLMLGFVLFVGTSCAKTERVETAPVPAVEEDPSSGFWWLPEAQRPETQQDATERPRWPTPPPRFGEAAA